MSTKKIVTVFAAAGRQGGGAVEYLCQDGTFHIRAITRNPDSDAAKALTARGVEVVKADLSNKTSLVKAMQGADSVFAVTDFWTANGQEETHRRNLVGTAKETGIKHFVWTTLDHSPIKVPHFETKANINDYLIASDVPRTSLYTSWFLKNVGTPFFALKQEADGGLILDPGVPSDVAIHAISGKDCGVLAGVILTNPDKYIGKDIFAATEHITPREMLPVLEEVTGEAVKVKEMTMEEFDEAKETMWEELWFNYKFFYAYSKRYVSGTLAILPSVRTLKDVIMEKGGKEAIMPK